MSAKSLGLPGTSRGNSISLALIPTGSVYKGPCWDFDEDNWTCSLFKKTELDPATAVSSS